MYIYTGITPVVTLLHKFDKTLNEEFDAFGMEVDEDASVQDSKPRAKVCFSNQSLHLCNGNDAADEEFYQTRDTEMACSSPRWTSW
mmetsp:Transcript_21883/g.49121  ORF Transcript_21883/g.49121 Transcript_21883/m.49121 type:complete len:86 (-) Transcript_21883:61-318(-)